METWGVFDELTQAWNLGLHQIMMEMDNLKLLKLLSIECDSMVLSKVVQAIKELIRICWEVQLLHTYREGNCLADAMDAITFDKLVGLYAFLDPPKSV